MCRIAGWSAGDDACLPEGSETRALRTVRDAREPDASY
jgi:hypothetical protein